jgi:hypothetical protein
MVPASKIQTFVMWVHKCIVFKFLGAKYCQNVRILKWVYTNSKIDKAFRIDKAFEYKQTSLVYCVSSAYFSLPLCSFQNRPCYWKATWQHVVDWDWWEW